jgi:hypothetical protein
MKMRELRDADGHWLNRVGPDRRVTGCVVPSALIFLIIKTGTRHRERIRNLIPYGRERGATAPEYEI